MLEQLTGYNSIELRAKQIVEGFLSGLHKSPFHGFSVEFADYRAYNTGESTRFIDWKLFARTDKLFIKNYQQETNLRCMIVMDNSISMKFPFDIKHKDFNNPDKLIFSVYGVAVLLQMLYRQRDAFGISLISDKIDSISDVKSSEVHKRHLFTQLEQLLQRNTESFPKNTDIAPVLHQLTERIHKRSLVIIFTDLLSMQDNEEFIRSLQHLKFAKHEIILFHVFDKNLEQQLEYKNRPYRFIDAETKQEVKINPSDIRDKYTFAVTNRFEQIHQACNDMHIDYAECDINKNFDQILIPYFYKRLRLR